MNKSLKAELAHCCCTESEAGCTKILLTCPERQQSVSLKLNDSSTKIKANEVKPKKSAIPLDMTHDKKKADQNPKHHNLSQLLIMSWLSYVAVPPGSYRGLMIVVAECC